MEEREAASAPRVNQPEDLRAPITPGHASSAAWENAAPASLRHASLATQLDPRPSAYPISARRAKPNRQPAVHPSHCVRTEPATRECRKLWAHDTRAWNLRVNTPRCVAGAWKRVTKLRKSHRLSIRQVCGNAA